MDLLKKDYNFLFLLNFKFLYDKIMFLTRLKIL